MKPTIEEVKEYFKDADIVKSKYGQEIKYEDVQEGTWNNTYMHKGVTTDTLWDDRKGYAKILTYKQPKFTPIAMRCSQEQFDAVRGKLKEAGIKISGVNNLEYLQYLVNDFNYKKEVTNLSGDCKHYKDNVHEIWNEKVFLEACGIVVKKPKEESFVITKSQALEIHSFCMIHDEEFADEVKELFPSAFVEEKKELVVEKWYKRVDSQKFLFCFQGEFGNAEDILDISYGFSHNGTWSNELSIHINSEFIEATSEEVKSALENEAVKRGLTHGKYIEDVIHKVNEGTLKSGYERLQISDEDYNYSVNGNRLFVGNLMIFDNGTWAKIIKPKQMTKSDIEKELGYKYEFIKE